MRIETVRVVNPALPSTYMNINKDNLTDAHELWPDQADSAEIEALYAPPLPPDDTDAVIAMRIVSKVISRRAGVTPEQFMALPFDQRVAQLRAAEAEIDGASPPVDDEPPAALTTNNEATPPPKQFHVSKGPKGLHYGWKGGERITPGFQTAAEAQTALEKLEAA